MKRLILAATAVAALLSGVSSANAAQYITWGPTSADGSFTGSFGSNGVAGDVNGLFSEVFNFALPTGVSSFIAASTFSSNPMSNITFSSIKFNGINFLVGSTGQNETRFLNGVSVTSGAPQQLVVSGSTGGNGSYSGVVSFQSAAAIAAVPEPAAWALMIVGFGGTGAMLRRRQKGAIAAA